VSFKCSAQHLSLKEREQHRRKLRSDKYKPPAGRLLEFYESDSSLEADEDTGDEAEGDDAGAAPDASGAALDHQVGGGETMSFCCCCCFCSQVRREEEEEEEEGGLPSGGGHSIDSDTSLAGG
jgi:hypothetical protein